MSKKIELDAPCLGEIEKEYLSKAVDSSYISSVGTFIPEFEKKMAQYLGAKAAAAVQSGTSAIYLSLYELGVGPGDEVIVPGLTFAATVNPVLYCGAKPVIVDVDPETWNIDSQRIKEAVTDKTKAIIPVHLYGNSCDMEAIFAIAREHNVFVIEDAAESLGAKIGDKSTGAIGDIGCLSFNGNKLITTGGGGMVVGNDIERIEHIRYLANQAKDVDKPGLHSEMGFNFRMSNIEAALGLAQMSRIEEFLNKKRKFRGIYQEILGDLPFVRFQKQHGRGEGSCWLTSISVDGPINIDRLIEMLSKKGVPSRRMFMPLNKMPYLMDNALETPNAFKIYDRGVCLPSSMINNENEIREVAAIVREVLSE